MAVQSVNLVRKYASASKDENRRGLEYRVVLTDPNDGPPIAITANDGVTAIPDIGDGFPGDSSIKAIEIPEPVAQDDSRLVYLVRVDYSDKTEDDGGGSGGSEPNPLDRPADIEWGFNSYTQVAEKDRDGDPIENSAGDVFDPPLEEQFYRLTCTIERNIASWNPATRMDFQDTVNASPITVAGASISGGQGLITNIRAQNAFENGVSYIRESITIEFAPSFARSVLDQGLYEVNGAGLRFRIRDDNNEPVVTPAKLNGSGAALTSGGTAVFIDFDLKQETNWAALDLPTTFPAS